MTKLLTKRVNFPSVQDVIDGYLPQFVSHFQLTEKQAEEMRLALFSAFERFLFEAAYAANLGAEKGITEAFEMMKDASYYETVKERKKRELNKNKLWKTERDEEAAERLRRKENPTLEERKSDVLQALREMIYYKDYYKKEKNKVVEFRQSFGDEELSKIITDKLPASEIWVSSFDVDKFIASLTFEKVSDGSDDDEDDFFKNNDWLQ